MISPYDLIGLRYRLGANPEKHGAADCLNLAIAVLRWYGIETPKPQREWYRRLKQGDTSVFHDELSRWGEKVAEPKIGTVALCEADVGFGMVSFFEGGWIGFKGSEVGWLTIDAPTVVALYCRTK